jgi:ATP-dependent Clp protease protease subunit
MEQITMDTDRDFFMSAEEAVEYGLIDAVISKPSLMMASNGAGLASAAA